METGLENYFIIKDNKKMRYGYTTGSCAAAASGAAVRMLLGQLPVPVTQLLTPRGILLTLELLDLRYDGQSASCAVRKDGGDDPDATHGLLVYARAEKKEGPGVEIDGGEGVGRVTKRGLEQPVGAAAINKVPREMIENEVKKACAEFAYTGGIRVVISIPGGVEVAKKTFNPRLGIEGGLSVLGTSGIVVPMSEDALIASIRTEMKMRRENGAEYLLVTPGNYGRDFLKNKDEIRVEDSMKCSNYVGETLDFAVNLGLKGILFVAHIGKFIKVSGGIMNTHSRCADARAELLCAHAIRAGADLGLAKRLLNTITTEEAVDILKEEGLLPQTMKEVTEKAHGYLQHRCGGALKTELILFSNNQGWLGQTEGTEELLALFKKDTTGED